MSDSTHFLCFSPMLEFMTVVQNTAVKAINTSSTASTSVFSSLHINPYISLTLETTL